MNNPGAPAIGLAKSVWCSVCHAAPDECCKDGAGNYRPPHVERGRDARWVKMGMKGDF
jgi:hypothetical protein